MNFNLKKNTKKSQDPKMFPTLQTAVSSESLMHILH